MEFAAQQEKERKEAKAAAKAEKEKQKVAEQEARQAKKDRKKSTKEEESAPRQMDIMNLGSESVSVHVAPAPAVVVAPTPSPLDALEDSLKGLDFSNGSWTKAEAEIKATTLQGVSTPATGQKGTLLERISGRGLRVDYEFSRNSSIYGPRMNAITLIVKNESVAAIHTIRLANVKLETGRDFIPFDDIEELQPGAEASVKVHLRISSSPLLFDVATKENTFPVKLEPSCGELMRKYTLSPEEFEKEQKKMSGLNQSETQVNMNHLEQAVKLVLAALNVVPLSQPSPRVYRFSAQLLKDDSYLLVRLTLLPTGDNEGGPGAVQVVVNSSEFVFGNHVLELLKSYLLNN